MGALGELAALILAMIRVSGARRERRDGWLAALRETAREARVMITEAADSRARLRAMHIGRHLIEDD